jgi:hypothetical protein
MIRAPERGLTHLPSDKGPGPNIEEMFLLMQMAQREIEVTAHTAIRRGSKSPAA